MRRLVLLFVGAALIAPLTGCSTTGRSNGCAPAGCGAGACGPSACGAGCSGKPSCLDSITTGQCDCNRDYNPLDPYNRCGVNRPPHLPTRQAGAVSGFAVGMPTTGTPITGVLAPITPHPIVSMTLPGSGVPVPAVPPEMLRENPKELPGMEK